MRGFTINWVALVYLFVSIVSSASSSSLSPSSSSPKSLSSSQITTITNYDFDLFMHLIEDSSIQSILSRSKYSFIYFYRHGCKYCSEFEPDFQFLSILYNNLTNTNIENVSSKKLYNNEVEQLEFQVLKTNGQENKRLNQLFKVQQYPTLKLLNYETKEILTYNKPHRDINSLIDFIQAQNIDVVPNYSNYQSNVKIISTSEELDNLINSDPTKETLVVFTMSYIIDWANYHYPTHFYQKLSLTEKYNHINFAIVEVDQLNNSDLLHQYHVSNFPSLIYFKSAGNGGGFKIYKTLSQNYMTNNVLKEEELVGVIQNSHVDNDPIFGTHFQNINDFHLAIDNSDKAYDGHKNFKRRGLFVRQQDKLSEDVDVNEEYDELLVHVEL